MKLTDRNKQTVYYATFNGTTEQVDSSSNYTGEVAITYASPVAVKMNVSYATNNARLEPFGINEAYQKVIGTEDMSCPIALDTVLWIGVSPNTANDNYNYKVVGVSVGLNFIRYACQEITSG